jgi:hypothetical protein
MLSRWGFPAWARIPQASRLGRGNVVAMLQNELIQIYCCARAKKPNLINRRARGLEVCLTPEPSGPTRA